MIDASANSICLRCWRCTCARSAAFALHDIMQHTIRRRQYAVVRPSDLRTCGSIAPATEREDRREGYPLENEAVGRRKADDPILIPRSKAFHLPGGETTYAPQAVHGRDDIETGIPARKVEPWPGAPYERTDTSLQAGVGPGSWVLRHDVHDRTWDEEIRIVPSSSARRRRSDDVMTARCESSNIKLLGGHVTARK